MLSWLYDIDFYLFHNAEHPFRLSSSCTASRAVLSFLGGVNTSSLCILNGEVSIHFMIPRVPLFNYMFAQRFIYGGIGMGVGAVAIISILALSNVSTVQIIPRLLLTGVSTLPASNSRRGHTSGHAFAHSFGPSSLSSAQFALL